MNDDDDAMLSVDGQHVEVGIVCDLLPPDEDAKDNGIYVVTSVGERTKRRSAFSSLSVLLGFAAVSGYPSTDSPAEIFGPYQERERFIGRELPKPPAKRTGLDIECPVCKAAIGQYCPASSLGKAGRKGAKMHKARNV